MPRYHYKGVTFARLNNDLKEPAGLPPGIRTGSATQKAMATGRKPTELDSIALWFSTEDNIETARDYCNKAQSDSVVLRANLADYEVTESSASVYTTTPVAWADVCFEGADGNWHPLAPHQGQTLPKDQARVRGHDDDSDDESD